MLASRMHVSGSALATMVGIVEPHLLVPLLYRPCIAGLGGISAPPPTLTTLEVS